MKRLLLLPICLGLGGFLPTRADLIEVSGDVWGVWSADTVVVTGEVRVPPGQTLSIEPGVKIYFFIYCKFIVDSGATILAAGTVSDSILFDEHWFWPTNGWHGIRFLSASDASRLEYCHLTNGYAYGGGGDEHGGAIYCDNSSPTMQNCLIDSCIAAGYGGGIYCYSNSSPSISGNTISGNSAYWGGGIYCGNSSPSIIGNTISGNAAYLDGGGIHCHNNSSPGISGNAISGNANTWGSGGGICCYDSDPSISGNTISENSATYGLGGGGIYCYNSSPSISGNTISNNSTYWDGGGICCYDNSNPSISGNTISGNSADDGAGVYIEAATISTFEFNEISDNSGEGIEIYSAIITMNKNTVVDNQDPYSGGISCYGYGSSLVLRDCILWGNEQQQIYLGSGGNVQATYNDIQDGWTGIGNINENPSFVHPDENDYRLQWGSHCIDAGDPDPIYNDPDGTVADMGAFYYDQSIPVRVLLTPYNAPIQISAGGGSFDFTIWATNIQPPWQWINVWCDIILTNGTIYGPVLGPASAPLDSGLTVSRERTQIVPPRAPAGVYSYNAYAVAGSDTSFDSFTFDKLGSGGFYWSSGWFNTGEPLGGEEISRGLISARLENFALHAGYPNPFNPTTTISYQLSAPSFVILVVYDVSGSKVAELVNGWREAGYHEVTFEGLNLASGMYIYRIQAGDYSASGKMVLMK